MDLPDLNLYKDGLDPASFPLKIEKVLSSEGIVEQVFISLVTLEGESVRIQLDTQGFHVIESSIPYTPSTLLKTTAADDISASPTTSSLASVTDDKETASKLLAQQEQARSGFVYETIEALLMALSPRFHVYFNNELSARLEAVDWSQSSSRWEHQSDSDLNEES
ncbi:hypothetical protein BGW42_008325 [Actinomortierella wolfii]|nr:hypothetical protein BGW42_008325 [Actinomortierella wolfii]